jgi:translation initiation factor IF-3
VIDENGNQVGIMSPYDAIRIARERHLDLVEISPTAEPPVCRITDFGRFKYELAKKEKQAKKRQHITHVKEIKLHPKTDAHDFNFKRNHVRRFLEKGDKVKLSMVFRGREITHVDLGRELLDRMKQEVSDLSVVESETRLEGRTITTVLIPSKHKGAVNAKDENEQEREEALSGERPGQDQV